MEIWKAIVVVICLQQVQTKTCLLLVTIFASGMVQWYCHIWSCFVLCYIADTLIECNISVANRELQVASRRSLVNAFWNDGCLVSFCIVTTEGHYQLLLFLLLISCDLWSLCCTVGTCWTSSLKVVCSNPSFRVEPAFHLCSGSGVAIFVQ